MKHCLRMLVFYVLFFMLVGLLAGCSSDLTLRVANDLFWPENDPREKMPWYSSVGGRSNSKGFTKLGG